MLTNILLFRKIVLAGIVMSLVVWDVWCWKRVQPRSSTFIGLCFNSMSLLLYAMSFVYVTLSGGAGLVGPTAAALRIGVIGIIAAFMGLPFGIAGIVRHQPGSTSATTFAACMGLLWLPAFLV